MATPSTSSCTQDSSITVWLHTREGKAIIKERDSEKNPFELIAFWIWFLGSQNKKSIWNYTSQTCGSIFSCCVKYISCSRNQPKS